MATCANCIHHSLCDYNTNVSGNGKIRLVYAEGSVKCSFFQNTADVVPKSEVEMLQGALKAEERHNELTMEMAQKALKNAKAEVAKEIFEEITRKVYSKIPDKILPVTFGEMSRHLDYSDGLNFGSRNAYFDTLKIIAELKKKYTEGEA